MTTFLVDKMKKKAPIFRFLFSNGWNMEMMGEAREAILNPDIRWIWQSKKLERTFIANTREHHKS